VGPPGRTTRLAVSLSRAHDVLTRVWPDTAAWVRLLVPAVMRVRQSRGRGIRLSGSFGPGYPIYLSETAHPQSHAEDLVHELQHLRFHLWRATVGWPPPARAAARFVSPFRPDLRPLLGVHLGLHAFLTVNDLRLHGLRHSPLSPAGVADTAAIHQRNLFAFATISAYEVPSPVGDRYLDAVAARLANQHDAITRLSTRADRQRAERALATHIAGALAQGPAAVNAGVRPAWHPPARRARSRTGRP
jgi:HEXXH motif-containing protein